MHYIMYKTIIFFGIYFKFIVGEIGFYYRYMDNDKVPNIFSGKV